jgi:hydroxymethylbilane synthase
MIAWLAELGVASGALMAQPLVRIGTRGSALALAQAHELARQLVAAHEWEDGAVDLRIIRTSGDAVQDRPLADLGGKGLFTKEIEDALLAGAIDLAVHSAKDMPTMLPQGLILAGCLWREDPRDVFISPKASGLDELQPHSVVGTASLRRQAMVKRVRPDVTVVPLRGNVETRLKKLAAGAIDATLLALAGLKRLGLASAATRIFSIEEFLPAVGQGAIAIETREGDRCARDLVAPVNHADTAAAIAAERAFLAELDGSCRTPIAGHARIVEGNLRFRGMVVKPDGTAAHETTRAGAPDEAVRLGSDAGRELKARVPADFFYAS